MPVFIFLGVYSNTTLCQLLISEQMKDNCRFFFGFWDSHLDNRDGGCVQHGGRDAISPCLLRRSPVHARPWIFSLILVPFWFIFLFQGSYSNLFKIVFLGDTAVGKSSIMSRFSDDSFDGSVFPTIGCPPSSPGCNVGTRARATVLCGFFCPLPCCPRRRP
jgi:hypothetical protein